MSKGVRSEAKHTRKEVKEVIAYLRYKEGKTNPHDVMKDAFSFWENFAKKFGRYFSPVVLSTVKQKDGTFALRVEVPGYYPVKELYSIWKYGVIRVRKDREIK